MKSFQGVIKQDNFVSIIGTAPPEQGMKTPTRSINNGDGSARQGGNEGSGSAPLTEEELRQKKIFDEHTSKIRTMKQQCEKECEEIRAQAHKQAEKIVDDADELAQTLRENVENDCVQLRQKAEEAGFAEGEQTGEKAGFEAGYAKGLEECSDTLAQLCSILERIDGEKANIFKEYENQLFDLIFSISNKITAGSLNQKDKSVISKMLKEAAKSFRGSSYVKVSLSKLDIEESVNVDLEDLRRIFGSFGEKQHIEFEILKDAPKGTLILDNGSEISDVGISTQLKMIENLGKGKFKHKPEEDSEESGDDAHGVPQEDSRGFEIIPPRT